MLSCFSSIVGFNVSITQNVSSRSLHILSSVTNQLRTRLYIGYLGSGAPYLAKFAHGLDESKIWSITVLGQDGWNSLVTSSYLPGLEPTVQYSWFSNSGFMHITSTDKDTSKNLALRPYRVMITYQEQDKLDLLVFE